MDQYNVRPMTREWVRNCQINNLREKLMATDIGRNNRSHVREAKREWKLSNNRNKDNGDGEKGRLRGLGEMSREPACKPCNCVQHNLEEQHDNWVAANNKAREGSRGNANTNQGKRQH